MSKIKPNAPAVPTTIAEDKLEAAKVRYLKAKDALLVAADLTGQPITGEALAIAMERNEGTVKEYQEAKLELFELLGPIATDLLSDDEIRVLGRPEKSRVEFIIEALDESARPHIGQPVKKPYQLNGRWYKLHYFPIDESEQELIKLLEAAPDTHPGFKKLEAGEDWSNAGKSRAGWHRIVISELTIQVKNVDSVPTPTNQELSDITYKKAVESVTGVNVAPFTPKRPARPVAGPDGLKGAGYVEDSHRAPSYTDTEDKVPFPQGRMMSAMTRMKAEEAMSGVSAFEAALLSASMRLGGRISVHVEDIMAATKLVADTLRSQTDIHERRIDRMAKDMAERVLYGFARTDLGRVELTEQEATMVMTGFSKPTTTETVDVEDLGKVLDDLKASADAIKAENLTKSEAPTDVARGIDDLCVALKEAADSAAAYTEASVGGPSPGLPVPSELLQKMVEQPATIASKYVRLPTQDPTADTDGFLGVRDSLPTEVKPADPDDGFDF
jgi:hypothetical protein